MIATQYLERGLDALARAHGRDSYFADGHRAGAVIAAYFMCHEQRFSPAADAAVVEWLDSHLEHDDLFATAPVEDDRLACVAPISEALRESGPVLREVGHNVIFASLALKAFRALPAAATQGRVSGIAALTRRFEPMAEVAEVVAPDVPSVESDRSFARFVCVEFLDCLERFSGFGQGWAGHMLTIARALIDLVDLGKPELARICHPAFCDYVALARRGPGPDARLIAEHVRSLVSPRDADYWTRRPFGLGHALKYPYAFYGLIDRLEEPSLRERCLREAYRVL
jgi:hypothetical protein